MKFIITEHLSEKEIAVNKKERLKKLKVIQEKADVKTYGGNRRHFTNLGKLLRPTIRKQHR